MCRGIRGHVGCPARFNQHRNSDRKKHHEAFKGLAAQLAMAIVPVN
jgi:hypothetical protein